MSGSQTVGGYMPSPVPVSRQQHAGQPSTPVGPPPAFAADAIDHHSAAASGGPIMSAESPVVSRRRSQPSSHNATPVASIGTGVGGANDAYADLRASRAALASFAPGRLTTVGPLAGQAEAAADVPIAPPSDAVDDEADLVEEEVAPLPLLPAGRLLMINCLTNWGDPHYVGIAGVDLFDAAGNRVEVRPDHVFGDPPHAPTGANVAANVVRRPHNTTDDDRMWLVPFTKGNSHVLVLVLPRIDTTLSVVRLWNFNNGRVHSTRGARLVEVTLDDKPITRCEIRMATGSARPDAAGDNAETFILTEDEEVLARVAAQLEADVARDDDLVSGAVVSSSAASSASGIPTQFAQLATSVAADGADSLPACSSISLEVLDTWGSNVVVGLSALRLLDANGNDIEDLTAAVEVPAEFTELFAASAEASTPLDGLFDGLPTTAWFARLVPGLKLRVDLAAPTQVAAVLVANAGIFDTSCGARSVRLIRDGAEVLAEDLVLRKAPSGLDALLFQTVRVADLANQRATGGGVAASVTARAAVGLRRAAMLQQEWPAFYAADAPIVALLPVGYTLAVELRVVASPDAVGADDSALPQHLTVSELQFIQAGVTDCDDSFFATSPASAVQGSSRVFDAPLGSPDGGTATLLAAFDEPRCLEGVRIAAAWHAGCVMEVTVLVDDAPAFQGVLTQEEAAAMPAVIPFTRNTEFLQRHNETLFRCSSGQQ